MLSRYSFSYLFISYPVHCSSGVDFLELLLFGIASDELNSFLLHNLTAKGLKKLAHSIESSYTNIQKLVLKNLQTVCQVTVSFYHPGVWNYSTLPFTENHYPNFLPSNPYLPQALVYHLSDLHGMSKWEDRFGQLGLEPDACLKTLQVAGGCFLKACDLQQAIDSSLKNFKAFFSWYTRHFPIEYNKCIAYQITDYDRPLLIG